MMATRKQNILITTSWFPTSESPNGVFVKEQGEALCRAGHKVTVLLITYSTLGGWLRARPPVYDKSELLSIVHVNVVFPMPARFQSDPNKYFKQKILQRVHSRMKKYFLANGTPDLIHHHCLSDNSYVAGFLSKTFGIPYVFTEHSNYFTYAELNRFNDFESFEDHRQFVLNACERIGVSNVRAKGYEAIFGVPFITVSNMVQELFASPLSRKTETGVFTFACVAILDKRKRQDILINAFAKEFRGQPVRLFLAGSGTMEETYRKQVNELQIGAQVTFCGKLNREQVVHLFDRADVAVLSSDQETFGVVLAEAMFRGIPVVSTICGGPEEIVTEETGLLCEKGNADALGDALKNIRNNYASYSPEKIRNYAAANFSEEVIVHRLEDIYASCKMKQQEVLK